MMSKQVRVRIAPSPTGIPHIGTTRTSLFNYLFAKHHKGTFVLRIEDTDRARLVPEAQKALYDILDWLELSWDEQYTQSERLPIYQEHADQLVEKGIAYKDGEAIRFRTTKDGTTSWVDAIGNKQIAVPNNVVEDFIIIKSDGYPTYNFANVIDDHLMEISHVIRGDEFISSTPKHIQLYQAFGWELPVFAHLPVILGNDKQKLSKRHGAKSALDYRGEGYLKEALLNYMALLGWNPGEDREVMDITEMISSFRLEDVNTGSPIFDSQKLLWMNGVYLRNITSLDLAGRLKEYYQNNKEVEEWLEGLTTEKEKILDLAKTRMKTLADFKQLVFPSIDGVTYSDIEKNVGKVLSEKLDQVSDWSAQTLLVILKEVKTEQNTSMKVLYKLLMGQEQGLPLPDMMEIWGKDEVQKRLGKTF